MTLPVALFSSKMEVSQKLLTQLKSLHGGKVAPSLDAVESRQHCRPTDRRESHVIKFSRSHHSGSFTWFWSPGVERKHQNNIERCRAKSNGWHFGPFLLPLLYPVTLDSVNMSAWEGQRKLSQHNLSPTIIYERFEVVLQGPEIRSTRAHNSSCHWKEHQSWEVISEKGLASDLQRHGVECGLLFDADTIHKHVRLRNAVLLFTGTLPFRTPKSSLGAMVPGNDLSL